MFNIRNLEASKIKELNTKKIESNKKDEKKVSPN
jgi:hypothetical protein